MSLHWKFALAIACILAGVLASQSVAIRYFRDTPTEDDARGTSSSAISTRGNSSRGSHANDSMQRPMILTAESDHQLPTRYRTDEGLRSALGTSSNEPSADAAFLPLVAELPIHGVQRAEPVGNDDFDPANRSSISPPNATPIALPAEPYLERSQTPDASLRTDQGSLRAPARDSISPHPPAEALDQTEQALPPNPPTEESSPRGPIRMVLSAPTSFWTISEEAYGTGAFYKALFVHNRARVPRPDQLQAGQEIEVPDLDELCARYPQYCPANWNSLRTANRSPPSTDVR